MKRPPPNERHPTHALVYDLRFDVARDRTFDARPVKDSTANRPYTGKAILAPLEKGRPGLNPRFNNARLTSRISDGSSRMKRTSYPFLYVSLPIRDRLALLGIRT